MGLIFHFQITLVRARLARKLLSSKTDFCFCFCFVKQMKVVYYKTVYSCVCVCVCMESVFLMVLYLYSCEQETVVSHRWRKLTEKLRKSEPKFDRNSQRMAGLTKKKNFSVNEDCVTKISNCSAVAHLTSGHVTLHHPPASAPL